MANHEELWESYIQGMREACASGDHGAARRIVGWALADAEEFEEIDPRLVWSVHELGSIYSTLGRFSDAAAIYKQLIETREKLLGPWHPDVTSSLEKLAQVQLTSRAQAGLQPA